MITNTARSLAANEELVQLIQLAAFPKHGFLSDYAGFRQTLLGMLPSASCISISHSYDAVEVNGEDEIEANTIVLSVTAFNATVVALMPTMVHTDILGVIADTLRGMDTDGYPLRYDGSVVNFNDLLVYAIAGSCVEDELDGDVDDQLLNLHTWVVTFQGYEVTLTGVNNMVPPREVNCSTRDGRRLIVKSSELRNASI